MDMCWIDGKILPATQASVNVLDHGLLYGDGVFEGMRFRHGRLFRPQAGLDRLHRSAAALRLSIPLGREEIMAALAELISAHGQATGADNGYIRLVVTRGVGRLGIDPATCPKSGLFMIAGQLSMASTQARASGARLIIASTRKPGPETLDQRIKSLNYLHNIMARMEATHAGADEAIMLNTHGFVAEGTAESVFIVSNGRLLTPPTEDGALEGITREAVLQIAQRLGLPARTQRMAPYDLYTADEMFLTGTGLGLLPVAEVDGRKMKSSPGEVYTAIHAEFEKLVDEETRQGISRVYT